MTPHPDQPPPPDARRRVIKAALLRPMSLLVVLIGGFFFAATLAWWAVLLTLATYAALVFLAVRDPIFRNRVLGTGRIERQRVSNRRPDLTPEQRASHLPPGETRARVEEALAAHGRLLVSVRETDEATRTALADALPKLRQFPGCLLEAAEASEDAATKVQALRPRAGRAPANLEERAREANAELASAPGELQAIRAKVVRASIESGDEAATLAAEIDSSLDAMNRRLEAIRSSVSIPDKS